MTLAEQLEWVENQAHYSAMLQDEDLRKWEFLYASLSELKEIKEEENGRVD
jgi:predicted lactoylglutathione lyase